MEDQPVVVSQPLYQSSTECGELFSALAVAQLKIVGAVKDSSNPFFKSKYADLSSVWDACHTHLNEVGISIIQLPSSDPARPDVVTLTTVLGHKSGQWISCSLSLRPAKADAQGMGSVISYARRYTLAAIAGVAYIEDDDGNAASQKGFKMTVGVASVSTADLDKLADYCKTNSIDRAKVKKLSEEKYGVVPSSLNPQEWAEFMTEVSKMTAQKEMN